MNAPLRIGTLGAARITPQALVKPARKLDDVEVVAVAARDPERAGKYARRHGIPHVHRSYEELIADPEIDAIYNPLPNSLHARWTLAAIAAGKPVLCEKPFTSNAAEAEEVVAAADDAGVMVMEAFHYRYHPLAARMHEIVSDGTLGQVRKIETAMCIPLPLPNDIRYRYELAGGATMDVGCYALHMNRLLGGADPQVVSAQAKRWRRDPDIDRWMRAQLEYPDGVRGTVTCALFSARLLDISVRVTGDDGTLRVFNPTRPQSFHRLVVRTADGRRRERFPGEGSYSRQLRAFVAAVRDGGPVLTSARDAIANMELIDAVYDAAGMKRRGT